MNITKDQLQREIDLGLVRFQTHPTLPLTIYNYAERVQYDKLWDDVLLQCRGLVMHGDKVVARPFRKFFNEHELRADEIPWHLPCAITEKMDGSLLIVFYFQGQWIFATRGSFISEQAQRGKEIFEEHYGYVNLDPQCTYLFEVIYPGNRIVVDYKGREDVVLLGMILTETGEEVPRCFWSIHLCHVPCLPPTASARELRTLIRDDQEGYVVRFENGFRMKVKGEKYMELHRIYSGINSRQVWEYASQGKSLDEILQVVPDEFAQWIKDEHSALNVAYVSTVASVFSAIIDVTGLTTRKEKALHILANHKDIAPIVFAELDGKDIAPLIWKQLYPEMRRPAGSIAAGAE